MNTGLPQPHTQGEDPGQRKGKHQPSTVLAGHVLEGHKDGNISEKNNNSIHFQESLILPIHSKNDNKNTASKKENKTSKFEKLADDKTLSC